jgi:hypothetical protein
VFWKDSPHKMLFDWWVGHELSIMRKKTFRNKNMQEIQNDSTNLYTSQVAYSDTRTVYPTQLTLKNARKAFGFTTQYFFVKCDQN